MNPLFIIPIIAASYSNGTILNPGTEILPSECKFNYEVESVVPDGSGIITSQCNVIKMTIDKAGDVKLYCSD